ncbi:MAG: hypothetical protein J5747_00495 [Spirochaetaceae bacterium]|nr:hypothetical protein [Spirochaetaceae bacterium]
MALVVATLKNLLKNTFLAMNNITDGSGDRYMADNVANNIKDYILTGKTSTTDTGVAPGGSYSGKGSGNMTIDVSSLADDLYSTFTAGYGNNDLASHIATDINKACVADNTVSETSKGKVTTPSGATSSFSGPAQGKFSGSKATIESKLKACFSSMDEMTSGGNEYFAQEMASAIDSYLKAGSISVTLKSPFLSGTGGGAIA